MKRTDPILYTPSGRAGEYANKGYALNLYKGCPHGCRYCYVPCNRFVTGDKVQAAREQFHASVTPVPFALERLERDLARLGKLDEPIFLSFNSDPYPTHPRGWTFRQSITHRAIELMKASGNNVRILTKGYIPCEDLDLLGRGDEVGVTLTLHLPQDHEQWEPGASIYSHRLFNLQRAKNKSLSTWASFEPVIDPKQTLDLVKGVSPFADVIKVGKANHLDKWNWPSEEWRKRVESIDWAAFATEIIDMLVEMEKPFVLKNDLVKYLPRNYRELYENRPACCWPGGVWPEVKG